MKLLIYISYFQSFIVLYNMISTLKKKKNTHTLLICIKSHKNNILGYNFWFTYEI